MHDSQRYRSNASECLLASYEANQHCYGRLNFPMAALWLALAGQDEAIDNLLASWGIAEPIETNGIVRLSRVSHTALQHIIFQEPLRQRRHPQGGLKGHDHVDIAKR
jgi:hypothetical protein